MGRNSNRCCLGYSLRAGLVFTKTPDHCVPSFGHKKAVMFGLRLARLKEFLRSVGDFTLRSKHVNSQDNHQTLPASHNKPLVPTAKSLRALAAAQRRRVCQAWHGSREVRVLLPGSRRAEG